MNIDDNFIPDNELLKYELDACGVNDNEDGSYSILIGNNEIICADLMKCAEASNNEVNRLKKELFSFWEKLGHITYNIISKPKYNDTQTLTNILFLNNVKKARLLSLAFDDLEEISSVIIKIYQLDISHIDEDLITVFNDLYLSVRSYHLLVMKELYRRKVIYQYMSLTKIATIAGPWSNLTIPQKERVWEWDADGDEEWFNEKEHAKKKQTRYNPEYNAFGVFYSWDEPRRNPYRAGDKINSPYPQRDALSIP